MSINDKIKGNTHIPLFLVFTALTAQTILLNVLTLQSLAFKANSQCYVFQARFCITVDNIRNNSERWANKEAAEYIFQKVKSLRVICEEHSSNDCVFCKVSVSSHLSGIV
jgi:hypothetical protein